MSNLDDFLAVLDSTRPHELMAELKTLQGIRSWAIEQLGLDYEVGDRVIITSPRPSRVMGGWAHYSEALAIGQTGIAGELKFDGYRGEWYLLVGMDRAWSVGNEFGGVVKRYWKGPACLTPEGFEPPSKYDQEYYPQGHIEWFHMDPKWIQKFTGDLGEAVPVGLSRYAADLARIHSEESC